MVISRKQDEIHSRMSQTAARVASVDETEHVAHSQGGTGVTASVFCCVT